MTHRASGLAVKLDESFPAAGMGQSSQEYMTAFLLGETKVSATSLSGMLCGRLAVSMMTFGGIYQHISSNECSLQHKADLAQCWKQTYYKLCVHR